MRYSKHVRVYRSRDKVSVHFGIPEGVVYPFDFPLWWSTDVARFVSVGYESIIVTDVRGGASSQIYVYFHRVYDKDTRLSLAEYGKKVEEAFSLVLVAAIALV
jgi:hypothetical protein